MLVIPWLADRSDCSSDAAPSWGEDCVSNWRECYLNIGGTPEYPAWQYLPTNITVSVPLLTALCEKKVAAEMQTLYDEEHCFVCQARQRAVSLSLVWTVFILEHVLVLVKLFLVLLTRCSLSGLDNDQLPMPIAHKPRLAGLCCNLVRRPATPTPTPSTRHLNSFTTHGVNEDGGAEEYLLSP